jgi:hypothetical protein
VCLTPMAYRAVKKGRIDEPNWNTSNECIPSSSVFCHRHFATLSPRTRPQSSRRDPPPHHPTGIPPMRILEAIQQAAPMSGLAPGPPRPIMPPAVLQASYAMPAPKMPLGAAAATPAESAAPKRITMWNKRENRKISGNAAPMEKNIDEYLRKHPECEVYNGQRSQLDPAIRAAQLAAEPRITIWNKSERRKVSGNAAPLEKNISEYLRKHPDCEVYDGQDKRPPGAPSPAMMGIPGGGRLGVGVAPGAQPYIASGRIMAVPRMPDAKDPYGWESPKCTLDFLAMIACEENLNLLHAEDYHSDGDVSEEEEQPQQQQLAEGKREVEVKLEVGKRVLVCSAIEQLSKRVKVA